MGRAPRDRPEGLSGNIWATTQLGRIDTLLRVSPDEGLSPTESGHHAGFGQVLGGTADAGNGAHAGLRTTANARR